MIIISKDKRGCRNVSSVRIGSAQNGDVIRVAGYNKMPVRPCPGRGEGSSTD